VWKGLVEQLELLDCDRSTRENGAPSVGIDPIADALGRGGNAVGKLRWGTATRASWRPSRPGPACSTPTRGYLHEKLVELGERLGAKLSEKLRACWFVCAGMGSGLSWGIGLVRDHESRRPADRVEAKKVVSSICKAGVLLGLMGRHGNVLEMRPPLPFSRDDADHALEAIDACLRAMRRP